MKRKVALLSLFILLDVLVVRASLTIPSSFPYEDPNYDWSGVDSVLKSSIAMGAYPGCTAIVGNRDGMLYAKSFGNYTYGIPPPMNSGTNPLDQMKTQFDMASCSKIIGPTTAIAQFYQRGEISLNNRITQYLGEAFGANGKSTITILNCLLHNAGYPPDPNPNYYQPQFGCPESQNYYPQENFSCSKKIYNSLLNQTLENPVGAVYVYSDLSMITLHYVIGVLARDLKYVNPTDLIPACQGVPSTDPASLQCYFEAYVRLYVLEPIGMSSSGYLIPESEWANCAPCENDTSYLHRVIQGRLRNNTSSDELGQVSDGNAYALGGLAGHAGVFSTALDVFPFLYKWMFPQPNDPVLNSTTASYFITEYNHTQSSRALGWNTNDPYAYDEGWDLSCGNMSARTFLHTGYTGTEMCGDPVNEIFTILLTNRVYPTSDNNQMHTVRQNYNNAVLEALGLWPPSSEEGSSSLEDPVPISVS